MTTNEAKKDLAKKLQELGIPFTKLRAKSVSFEDLARDNVIFVYIDGGTFTRSVGLTCIFGVIPKPSEGGYIPQIGNNYNWKD